MRKVDTEAKIYLHSDACMRVAVTDDDNGQYVRFYDGASPPYTGPIVSFYYFTPNPAVAAAWRTLAETLAALDVAEKEDV
jgi:hypothetical protein